jgi:methionyl-tRNA formyltransferase
MSSFFIGKANDLYCERAKEFVTLNFPDTTFLIGKRGDRFPKEYMQWQGEYIISYLSPWIVPEFLLKSAKIASINFHPGPPEYPGIGCTNFAIYNQEPEFGVTCHHMAAKVDTGKIIAVRRFPLFESDSVFSLTQRCYAYILSLFYDIISEIILGKPLPSADETWQRKPYTRAELNALCKTLPDMPIEEIKRRVKATTFPGMPGPYIEIEGVKFTISRDT